MNRDWISKNYIRGHGIELGACSSPFKTDAHVIFVDKRTKEQILEAMTDLDPRNVVQTQVIDDMEKLSQFRDNSQDFVIGSHVLEHCKNVFQSLDNHVRVLKPGGVLFHAVPDLRFTFDKKRPITSLEHLAEEYLEGVTEKGTISHLVEYFMNVDSYPEEKAKATARDWYDRNQDIHYHAWDDCAIVRVMNTYAQMHADQVELFFYCRADHENFFLFRKKGDV